MEELGRTRRGMILSVASRDPEGLSEKERKKREQQESVPGRLYKKRSRSSLTADEQQEIIDAYMKDNIPQKEVAKRFRITI